MKPNELKEYLVTLFGENYRTTIFGNLALVCVAIATYPTLTEWIPDSFKEGVRGVAGIIAFALGGKTIMEMKDAKNTKSLDKCKEIKCEVEKLKEQINED